VRHSKEKIENIKVLRCNGKSILEICRILKLSKTTVWHHIRDIHLNQTQKKILREKGGQSSVKRRVSAELLAGNEADKLLVGQYREEIIIIAMLYWAEGSKTGRCEFINTDPRMIKVYLSILRNVLKITDNSIFITIRIFDGMDKAGCMKFWSRVTNINKDKFSVRLNDGGNSSRSRYGLCRITILRGHQYLKLMHALVEKISVSY
jgi:hypothetical protein